MSIYSYCCYLGKRKSRTIVEEKCNWDIVYLDSINIICGLVVIFKFVWNPAIPQLPPLLHCPAPRPPKGSKPEGAPPPPSTTHTWHICLQYVPKLLAVNFNFVYIKHMFRKSVIIPG